MVIPAVRSRFSDWLTSRSGAWISLGVFAFVVVAVFGAFSSATAPGRGGPAPAAAESAQVESLLASFPDAHDQPLLLVASRADGTDLSADDVAGLTAMLPRLRTPGVTVPSAPVVSADAAAAMVVLSVVGDAADTDVGATVASLRAQVAAHTPAGLTVQVTGGAAFGADVASAFDGADLTLLLVTILIVAVLLILTYRSPILWLIPLVVVALADGVAGRLTAAVGTAWGFAFDAGIVSVLVFGAGTNYALLLISRYREELLRTGDDRAALSVAWRHSVPAIVASNLTVVLALSSLTFAAIPATRGLGIPAALGLLIALAAVVLVLPPLLAVCGRRVFWPVVPRPGDQRAHGRRWRAVATRVTRRPVVTLLAGAALLTVMASGLFGASLGLDQLDKFRTQSESAIGLSILADHFPAGDAQPIYVVADSTAADAVVATALGVRGVVRAGIVGSLTDGAHAKVAKIAKISVVSAFLPGSEQSLDQIVELRAAVRQVPDADAMVGGAVATELDARAGNTADLLRTAPLVLAVCFLALLVLLRSLVASALLLVVNLASAIAALGLGAWLSRVLLDRSGLDPQVPLLAFLFLVALGIDYTIFLVHRARTEAVRLGTSAGMVEAVARTGGVITSAGVVLAAVFAALGVLPLVTLGQLGLIVGVGVLVDTLVVRTMIIPAIFALLGDRIWWPGRLSDRGGVSHEPAERVTVAH